MPPKDKKVQPQTDTTLTKATGKTDRAKSTGKRTQTQSNPAGSMVAQTGASSVADIPGAEAAPSEDGALDFPFPDQPSRADLVIGKRYKCPGRYMDQDCGMSFVASDGNPLLQIHLKNFHCRKKLCKSVSNKSDEQKYEEWRVRLSKPAGKTGETTKATATTAAKTHNEFITLLNHFHISHTIPRADPNGELKDCPVIPAKWMALSDNEKEVNEMKYVWGICPFPACDDPETNEVFVRRKFQGNVRTTSAQASYYGTRLKTAFKEYHIDAGLCKFSFEKYDDYQAIKEKYKHFTEALRFHCTEKAAKLPSKYTDFMTSTIHFPNILKLVTRREHLRLILFNSKQLRNASCDNIFKIQPGGAVLLRNLSEYNSLAFGKRREPTLSRFPKDGDGRKQLDLAKLDSLPIRKFLCPFSNCERIFRAQTVLDLAIFYIHLLVNSSVCTQCPTPGPTHFVSQLSVHTANAHKSSPSVPKAQSQVDKDLEDIHKTIAKVIPGYPKPDVALEKEYTTTIRKSLWADYEVLVKERILRIFHILNTKNSESHTEGMLHYKEEICRRMLSEQQPKSWHSSPTVYRGYIRDCVDEAVLESAICDKNIKRIYEAIYGARGENLAVPENSDHTTAFISEIQEMVLTELVEGIEKLSDRLEHERKEVEEEDTSQRVNLDEEVRQRRRAEKLTMLRDQAGKSIEGVLTSLFKGPDADPKTKQEPKWCYTGDTSDEDDEYPNGKEQYENTTGKKLEEVAEDTGPKRKREHGRKPSTASEESTRSDLAVIQQTAREKGPSVAASRRPQRGVPAEEEMGGELSDDTHSTMSTSPDDFDVAPGKPKPVHNEKDVPKVAIISDSEESGESGDSGNRDSVDRDSGESRKSEYEDSDPEEAEFEGCDLQESESEGWDPEESEELREGPAASEYSDFSEDSYDKEIIDNCASLGELKGSASIPAASGKPYHRRDKSTTSEDSWDIDEEAKKAGM
ncbi:hypothetical protein BJ508DRAFT_378266 [Ascobolus immersus RN42]|uniref:Uncharacterized protein n=1 Tax=Ascobolus immersus RN42 TaxID=1160509 RepID=A0A3N4HXI4_ASCIM|nr:hypothetical protein BJ508DRAFT_378266 [Ascobolus immersus RN42]